MNFAIPADNRVRIKENEKGNKYLNISRELKKMKVTVKVTMPIVIRALGTKVW